MGRLRACKVDSGAQVCDIARIDHQHLAALGTLEVLERRGNRVDRPHGRLTADDFTELEQQLITSGYRGDVHRQPHGGDGSRARGTRCGGPCPESCGRIRHWNRHLNVSPSSL